jgi:Ala-tRNA(Pro) deacylase
LQETFAFSGKEFCPLISFPPGAMKEPAKASKIMPHTTHSEPADHLTPHQLLARLDAMGISAVTHHHPPLHTVEESKRLRGDIPGAQVKNLFLKDEKGELFLITALESTQIQLKNLHKRIGCKRLSFGRAELLYETLGVRPGSVTPFALINDRARRVGFILDKTLLEFELIGAHPLTNEMTSVLTQKDLFRFFSETGHDVQILDLSPVQD